MANNGFNLTSQINAQLNVSPEFKRDIDKLLNQQMNVSLGGNASFRNAQNEMRDLDKTVRRVRGGLEELGNVVGTAARRFGGISVATGTFLGLARGIKNSVSEAITFEREMIKVAQATDNAVNSTETLRKNIMQVADSYGASGVELAKYSRILAQAGFSVKRTEAAIKLLAKADLTGTFGGISENVDGMVAIMQQFGKEATRTGKEIEFLQKAYDSISRVSKKYAVESGDIIEAVKKAGGVFATAGGSLEEFIAIMTSVRATTRESADVIANGLKTIATRLQDKNNIKALQALGIELEDSKGNFIGVFEAVQRLSAGLRNLDPKSIRFANIVKELGGIYQIGRFITLIKEAKLSQEALNEAKNASGDIDRDVAKQQASLGFKIDQLRQKFNNLILEFTKTGTFKEFTQNFLEISQALLSVGESIRKNLPLFKTFFTLIAARAGMYAFQSWSGTAKPLTRKVPNENAVASEGWGNAKAFKSGGHVKSNRAGQKSDQDSLNAVLQPGEYVLRKKAVNAMGVNTLNMMNQGLFNTVDIASRRKAMFTNKGKSPTAYSGTVAQVLRKTKLKSLENLYDIVDPEDSFYAPFINRLPLRHPDGAKVRLADIKSQASQLMYETMNRYSSGGPKSANDFISSTLGGFADKVSKKTFSDSGNAFKFITSIQGSIAEQIFRQSNPNYQKLPNAYGMDMVSSDGKFAEIKATSTRMSPYTMIGKALVAIAKLNNPSTGFKNKKKDVIGIPETTFFDTALRFNTGGTVPGSGRGDKIPALLEPGEVVVNRRAAKNVGYDVLHAMNRGSISMLSKGGEAGGKKYIYTNQNRQKDVIGSQKSFEELVGNIKSGGSNADIIAAETQLLKNINTAVGDWGKVGTLFEKLIGRAPKASSIAQIAKSKVFYEPMGKGFNAKTAYPEMKDKKISQADIDKVSKGIPLQSIGQAAQIQAQVETTKATQDVGKSVQDTGNKIVEATNKLAEETKASTEAVKASPKNTLGPNASKLGILGEAEKQVKKIDKAQSEQEQAAEIKANQSNPTPVKPDISSLVKKYENVAANSDAIDVLEKEQKGIYKKAGKRKGGINAKEEARLKEIDKEIENLAGETSAPTLTATQARQQSMKEVEDEQAQRLASQPEATPVKTGSATPLYTDETAKAKAQAEAKAQATQEPVEPSKAKPKTGGGGGRKKPPQTPVATGGMPPEKNPQDWSSTAAGTPPQVEPPKPLTVMQKLGGWAKSKGFLPSTKTQVNPSVAQSFQRGGGELIKNQADADKILKNAVKSITSYNVKEKLSSTSVSLQNSEGMKSELIPEIAKTQEKIKNKKNLIEKMGGVKGGAKGANSPEVLRLLKDVEDLEKFLGGLQKASSSATGYALSGKKGTRIGLRSGAATQSTLMHEVGHGVDYEIGGGKAASTQEGTFQYTIAEKLKPILRQVLVAEGKNAKEIEYRTKNQEIIADLYANGTDEIRMFISATTEASIGMEAIATIVEKAEKEGKGMVAGLGGLTSKQLRTSSNIIPDDFIKGGEKAREKAALGERDEKARRAFISPEPSSLTEMSQRKNIKRAGTLYQKGSAISQQGLMADISNRMTPEEIAQSENRVAKARKAQAKAQAKAQVMSVKSAKAQEMLTSGMSQQDVNKWFGTQEGKDFTRNAQQKAKASSKQNIEGTSSRSELTPQQAHKIARPDGYGIDSVINRAKSLGSVIAGAPGSALDYAGGKISSLGSKAFKATEKMIPSFLKTDFIGSRFYGRDEIGRVKRPGLTPIPGVDGGGGGVPPNTPVGGAAGGGGGSPGGPTDKAASEAAKKMFDLSSGATPLILSLGLLLSSSDALIDSFSKYTGLQREEAAAIQNAITGATAFYLTMQQISALVKRDTTMNAAGDLLDVDGNPTGKKAGRMRRLGGRATARFGGVGGLLTTAAIGGAAGSAIGGYYKEKADQKAGKIEKKLNDELTKLEVGGTAGLETLQARAREAAGLRSAGTRGQSFGMGGGILGGVVGGAIVGGAAASPTVIGIPLGMAAGALAGGIAGGAAGVSYGQSTYKQSTAEERSINASISAQYAAAKSTYNFAKAMDRVRSGNLKTSQENAILVKSSEDLAKSMEQARVGARIAGAELKSAEDYNSTAFFTSRDVGAFEGRKAKAVEAEAQIKEQAKQQQGAIRDAISKTLTERLSQATSSEELGKIGTVSGTGTEIVDKELNSLLKALEVAAGNASDETDPGKRDREAAQLVQDIIADSGRVINARSAEAAKIQSAINIRNAELAIIQKVNAAMQQTAETSFKLQESQRSFSVMSGQSLGGYNTDRIKDLTNIGTNRKAFDNTLNALAPLVKGGNVLAAQAGTAASASKQFRDLTPSSGLLTGLNALRSQFKPGSIVNPDLTKSSIADELNKISPDFKNLGGDIKAKVIEELYGVLSEGKVDLSVINDISKTIADSGQSFADVLVAAGEAANNYIEQMQTVNSALIAENNKLTELKSGSLDIRGRAMERMASVSTLGNAGQKQLEQNREAFRVARDKQTLAGAGLNIAGGTTQYGAELQRITASINANKKLLSPEGNLSVEQRDIIGTNQMKLENQAQSLTAVLSRLTDQSDKASDKMAEISRLQAQKEFVKGRAESFAFGTMEERMNMAQTNTGLQQVMKTGNFQMLPDELKGSVRDLMKQIAELNPEGAVAQMYKGIQINAIKQQQAMGFLGKKDADQAIAAVKGEDLAQEKKLKAELNKIAQDELVAQQALIDAQAQLTQVYKDLGDKLRADFLPNQQPQAVIQPINVQQQAQAQAQAQAQKTAEAEEVKKPPKRAGNISLKPRSTGGVGTSTSEFKPDADIINQSFSRSRSSVIYGLEEAKNRADEFKATLGENASLIKDTKMAEGVSNASYFGEFRPDSNTVGINPNPIKSSVVDHELGHATDLALGKNKQYSSHTQGTFQNSVVEQMKPLLESGLRSKGMPEDYIKYRTTNTEVFADLMANTTPEARKILTSTTDSKAGMDALRNYETKLGTNIPGFAGIPISQQKLDVAPSMQAPTMSFEPIIQNMRTFTDKLAEVSQAFSNISMTHTLNVDGQINIGGVDISSIATQLRNSLGEYIGQAIEDEFNKRASTFRTA